MLLFDPMNKNHKWLLKNNQDLIHYYYKESNNNLPVIIFLPGYISNIKSIKAVFLKNLCKKNDYSYLTFDYRGHGESSGNFTNYAVDDWLDDVICVINNFVKNKNKILVGSSMGGWLSFLYAVRYPQLVEGIIGIAPALDFTEDIKKHKDSLLIEHPQNKDIFILNNAVIPNTFISKKLLETSDELLMLKSKINLNMPIRLLHGMLDQIVEYNRSLQIKDKLLSNNVIVHLIKNGDHSLNASENLSLLEFNIHNLIHKL